MKSKKAFTLIELLVVIAIIGILTTVAVVALNNARAKARDAKRVADVKQIQTALELYFNDKGQYPTNEEFETGAIYSTSSVNGTTTYMAAIPTAPDPADGSCSDNENSFDYYQLNNGESYRLTFCVGGTTGSIAPGYTMANPTGFSVPSIACNDIQQECDPTCDIGSTCGGGTLVSVNPNLVIAPSSNEEGGCVGAQDCTGLEDSVNRIWGSGADAYSDYNDGRVNVAAMKASGGWAIYIAAKYCDDLNTDGIYGFGDWYLPGYYELILVHAADVINLIGGFNNAMYWTSSSVGYWGMIYSYNIESGAAANGGNPGLDAYGIRCARRF